jgi:hypothetical protein
MGFDKTEAEEYLSRWKALKTLASDLPSDWKWSDGAKSADDTLSKLLPAYAREFSRYWTERVFEIGSGEGKEAIFPGESQGGPVAWWADHGSDMASRIALLKGLGDQWAGTEGWPPVERGGAQVRDQLREAKAKFLEACAKLGDEKRQAKLVAFGDALASVGRVPGEARLEAAVLQRKQLEVDRGPGALEDAWAKARAGVREQLTREALPEFHLLWKDWLKSNSKRLHLFPFSEDDVVASKEDMREACGSPAFARLLRLFLVPAGGKGEQWPFAFASKGEDDEVGEFWRIGWIAAFLMGGDGVIETRIQEITLGSKATGFPPHLVLSRGARNPIEITLPLLNIRKNITVIFEKWDPWDSDAFRVQCREKDSSPFRPCFEAGAWHALIRALLAKDGLVLKDRRQEVALDVQAVPALPDRLPGLERHWRELGGGG